MVNSMGVEETAHWPKENWWFICAWEESQCPKTADLYGEFNICHNSRDKVSLKNLNFSLSLSYTYVKFCPSQPLAYQCWSE